MSIVTFTEEQIEILRNNPYVTSVTDKYINYTEEFKQLFYDELTSGCPAKDIFKKCGFNPELISNRRISNFKYRILAQSERLEGFKDTRITKSGRKKTKALSDQEKLTIMEKEIKILKQENDFLKRVRLINKKQIRKDQLKEQRKKNTSSF